MRTLIAASAVTFALLTAPSFAQMSGTSQFCLKGPTGAAQCNYQTMAQCEQAKPAGSTSQCLDKSQVQGTTGSGTGTPGSSTMPPAGGTTTPPPQR